MELCVTRHQPVFPERNRSALAEYTSPLMPSIRSTTLAVTRFVKLRDEWLTVRVEVGDYVHVIGEFCPETHLCIVDHSNVCFQVLVHCGLPSSFEPAYCLVNVRRVKKTILAVARLSL